MSRQLTPGAIGHRRNGRDFARVGILGAAAVAMLAAGLAVVGGSTGAAAASSAPQYVTVDLGTSSVAAARAVNASGQVVGQLHAHAFSWTDSGGMLDLGTLGGPLSNAVAVNDGGEVAGTAHVPPDPQGNATSHAFRWSSATGMVDLGVPWGSDSYGVAINAGGQVAGYAFDRTTQRSQAVLWDANGTPHLLGTFGHTDSRAVGVDDGGAVAGTATDWSGPYAFVWSSGGVSYPALPGGDGSARVDGAHAGYVVGVAGAPGGETHAFEWSGGSTTDLGVVGVQSDARAVNSSGDATGVSGPSAALWRGGTMTDLGNLGCNANANAISDTDEVVGQSQLVCGAARHAFAWTQAKGIVDLGTFGGDLSEAYAVNGNGFVVGMATDAQSNQHAVVWETNTPKAAVALTAQETPGSATIGGPAYLTDTATFANSFAGHPPTGSVTFSLYSDTTCTTSTGTGGIEPITVGNGTASASISTSWTPPTVGQYWWRATYPGDPYNLAASTPCADPAEKITVGYDVLGINGLKSSYRAGSTIRGTFQLANASGIPIADSEAQSIATNCQAKVNLDTGVPVCATYTKRSTTFSFSLPTTKSIARGSHTVTLQVYAGSAVVNTTTATVTLI